MATDIRKPIHVAVGNLCLKSYGNREAALQSGITCPAPIPRFILQLRQRREAAQARKQGYLAKTSQTEDKLCHDQGSSPSTDERPRPRSNVTGQGDISTNTQPKQHATVLTSMPSQSGGTSSAPRGEPLWHSLGFDDQLGGTHVSMDPDFILDQDEDIEGHTIGAIDWEQWDSWLADSNAPRPLSAKGEQVVRS